PFPLSFPTRRSSVLAGGTLISESSQVVTLFTVHIAEPGNVEAIRSASVVILVLIAFDPAACTNTEVVVHQVMPEFAATAAETIWPHIGGGVHEYPGRIERGGVQ